MVPFAPPINSYYLPVFFRTSIMGWLLWLCVLAVGIKAQPLTPIELESRDSVPTPIDTAQADSDWMGGSEEPDTLEYQAIDLQYDVQTRTFNLNDKAQLRYRTAVLNADTILFDQEHQVLQASGAPVMREKSHPPLAAYRMKYNIEKKLGQVYYASGYQDNQRFNGMEIRRLPDGRLQIARGDFSTCGDTAHQHFFFYGRRMVVKPKESVTARPVVLNIADVPVAVLPMMVSPLKSGRRSGLLTPKFGGDQMQGFYLRNLGYYYAPNDYWDAQVYADVVEGSKAEFEKSSGTSLVRYSKRYTLDGNVKAVTYFENQTPLSDYDISFSHNQNLTPDRRKTLSGSGSFVSRRDLRQTNGLDEETLLNQQANAEMTYAQRIGNNKSLTVKARQDYNLATGNLKRQLPDVQFRSSGPMFSADDDEEAPESSFLDNFNYSYSNHANVYSVRNYDSTELKDTTSYALGYTDNLTLDYSGSLFDVFTVTPSINLNGIWTGRRWINPEDSAKYRRSRNAFDPGDDEYGEYFLHHDYRVTTATKLYGIWLPEWGRFSGARHILSPEVTLLYAPEIDTNRYFAPHPLLSQSPFQAEQRTIALKLGNDFDIKYLRPGGSSSTSVREKKAPGDEANSDDTDEEDIPAGETATSLRLLTTSHSTQYNFAADSFNFSPIESSFGLQLIENYIFTVRTRHDFYHRFEEDRKKLQTPQLVYWGYELTRSFQWNGDFNAGLPSRKDKYAQKPWSAGFNYSYSYSSERVGREMFKETIRHTSTFRASLYPTRHWSMGYNTQYDYTAGEFAKHSFTFSRDLHCWKMDFAWTPVGPAAGWNFSIYVTDLPDIKLNAASTRTSS